MRKTICRRCRVERIWTVTDPGCKPCKKIRMRTYLKVWRKTNPDRASSIRKRHYQKTKEKELTYTSQYVRENRAQINARRREYLRSHPEKAAQFAHKRRARLKNATGLFTSDEWAAIKEAQRNRCAVCKMVCNLTVDHIIPLSKGGSNWPDNIQGLCMSCNCSKHDKHSEEVNQRGR